MLSINKKIVSGLPASLSCGVSRSSAVPTNLGMSLKELQIILPHFGMSLIGRRSLSVTKQPKAFRQPNILKIRKK